MFNRQVAAVGTAIAAVGSIVAVVVLAINGTDVPTALEQAIPVTIGALAGMAVPEGS